MCSCWNTSLQRPLSWVPTHVRPAIWAWWRAMGTLLELSTPKWEWYIYPMRRGWANSTTNEWMDGVLVTSILVCSLVAPLLGYCMIKCTQLQPKSSSTIQNVEWNSLIWHLARHSSTGFQYVGYQDTDDWYLLGGCALLQTVYDSIREEEGSQLTPWQAPHEHQLQRSVDRKRLFRGLHSVSIQFPNKL